MKAIISAVAFAGLFTLGACNRSDLQEKDAAIEAQQHTIDSMNEVLAKQKIVDSMQDAMSLQYILPPAALSQPGSSGVSSTRRSGTRTYSGRNRTSTNTNNAVAQAPVYQAPQKKGWSAKAKGAVIGAGAGAAAGAIINRRNRAAGAVIGGVLGAGAGTGVGAVIDKKKGR